MMVAPIYNDVGLEHTIHRACLNMAPFPTVDLASTPLFAPVSERLSVAERINLSHERAKAIGLRYGAY